MTADYADKNDEIVEAKTSAASFHHMNQRFRQLTADESDEDDFS